MITYSIFLVLIVIMEYTILGTNKENSIPAIKPVFESFGISPLIDSVLAIGIIMIKKLKPITIKDIKKRKNFF